MRNTVGERGVVEEVGVVGVVGVESQTACRRCVRPPHEGVPERPAKSYSSYKYPARAREGGSCSA